jgi:succinoglycan biosynthesis protein ExoA
MTTASPLVSIVVPCRNEADHIESCVRSILGQQPPEGDFELIVADGMSDDASCEILQQVAQQDPRLRIVNNPGRIVSTALNTAIRLARGKIIIRMDAHTEYASDYIQRCVEVLQETGADNVGGAWIAEGKGLAGRAIAAAFESPFAVGGARGHDSHYEGKVDTVYLGCWPRYVFERFGLFDEELVRNQDDEFSLRLTRGGGKIWQSPRIKSRYRPRESLRSLFKQYLQYGYWKVRVIQKHTRPASIRHLLPAGFIVLLLFFSALSPWWASAGWALLTSLACYLAVNTGASLLVASQRGWKIFFALPIVFACFHFAYGIGFLHGVWDFLIVKRGPSSAYIVLTRGVNRSRPKATSITRPS